MEKRRKVWIGCILLLAFGLLTGKAPAWYPVCSEVLAAEAAEQSEAVTWTLENGILTITGSGCADASYASFSKEQLEAVTEIRIEDGVTSLMNFNWFSNVEKIEMADSVTELYIELFQNCKALSEVALSNNIKKIPERTFYGCSALKNITLPEGLVEIEIDAFSMSGLETIRIPASVTRVSGHGKPLGWEEGHIITSPVGKRSFEQCTSLTSFLVEEGNTTFYSEDGVLYYKNDSENDMSLLEYPDGKADTSVTVSKKATKIESSAFDNCRPVLTSIALHSGISDLQNTTFSVDAFVKLESIQVDADNQTYASENGVLFKKINNNRRLVLYPRNKPDTTYILPENTISVYDDAFRGNAHLQKVEFPEGVESIGSCAFAEAAVLSEVVFPDSLKSVGQIAFVGCEKLKTIKIPGTVESIGCGAFGYITTDNENVSLNLYSDEDYSDTIYDQIRYEGVTIIGDEDSVAHIYATKNNIIWQKSEETASYTLDSLRYSFTNTYESFGYSSNYRIPLKIYEEMFGKTTLAKTFYNYNKNWGGNCFGISATTGMFNVPGNQITVKMFRQPASKVHDLQIKDKSTELNHSLLEFIELMQTSQYMALIQKDYNTNQNKTEEITDIVKQLSQNNNPLILAVFGPQGGHAIIPYAIEEKDATTDYLRVYDCNFDNKEKSVLLYKNSSGQYTGWYYSLNDRYDYGSDYKGCSLSYVPYEHYEKAWKERGKNISDTNLLVVNSQDVNIRNVEDDIVASVKDGELETQQKDIYMIKEIGVLDEENPDNTKEEELLLSLPTDLYTIENKDTTIDSFQATMVNQKLGATITSAAKTITFAVNDSEELNSVQVEQGKGDSYEIVLECCDENESKIVEVKGVGNGQNIAVSTMNGKLSADHCAGAQIKEDGKVVQEGTQSAEQRPEKPDESKYSVQNVTSISINGISKKIAAGKKIQLTTVVLPSGASNKEVVWKSSNKKVATVSQSGVVMIKKNTGGKSVTITATAKDGSGKTATYKIRSMKGVVKKISVSGKKSVKAGKSLKLKAKVKATKGANKKIKWTSSNSKYAKVSSSGKIKTYKAGKGKKVIITVMATDGSNKKKSVTIKLK